MPEGDRASPKCLREWLDHRRDVLVRRSQASARRRSSTGSKCSAAYLIAYLNLDKVIKIIRNEDEPKPVLMKTFKLTDVQADAILNMRLRNLRKLEEMEIRREDKDSARGAKKLKALLGSEAEQWKTVADQIKEVRETFGPKTALGKRRTTFAEAPEHDEAAIEEAMVEREPITVVVSEKGWIRALRGHVTDLSGVAFKADDELKFAFPAETTSKLPGLRDQRPLLHHRRSEAAGRARPWRAGAAVHRPRAGRRHRLGVPLSGRPQIPGGEQDRARLRRGRGRMPRQHPQGQAGAQREGAGRGARDRAGRGRARRERSARTARW